MVTKRVLIIGGSYSALPIAEVLKDLEIEIICMSGDLTEPLIAFSDQVINSDYSNIEKSIQEISKIQFDYVIPSCNDAAYTLGAKIAHRRGLPGFDTPEHVEIINSKILFREFCNKNNLRSPKEFKNHDELRENDFPVIVKPNKSFSGRGISIVREGAKLGEAIDIARDEGKDSSYNIEKYVPGTLHSLSAFVDAHSIKEYYFVDEYCSTYEFQVDKSHHPSSLSIERKSEVVAELQRLIDLLELVDGLIHIQFINNTDTFYFIECMRRCPGDLYGNLIEYSTGNNYYRHYVNGYLDYDILTEPKVGSAIPMARFTESSQNARIFKSFSVAGNVFQLFPLVGPGTKVSPAPYGKTAIGFIQYENESRMFNDYVNFGNNLKVNNQSLGKKKDE